ncbi:MAG: aminodeoxychorismate/anthranilate synthase component II [Clostridiaceae bacterium]
MFLMIDNYDSFVYNLVRYFHELEEEILIYRNDKITIDDICRINPEGIIISPGPKNPKEAGICNEIINTFKESVPILGICLGHQCIGYSFGGEIIKGDIPMHGKVSKVYHNGEGVFENLPSSFNVTRYHSLVIHKDNLPCDLEITAETDDGAIMGVKHRKYNIEGVQFHPEAELTEYGHELLKNFIDKCRSNKTKISSKDEKDEF